MNFLPRAHAIRKRLRTPHGLQKFQNTEAELPRSLYRESIEHLQLKLHTCTESPLNAAGLKLLLQTLLWGSNKETCRKPAWESSRATYPALTRRNGLYRRRAKPRREPLRKVPTPPGERRQRVGCPQASSRRHFGCRRQGAAYRSMSASACFRDPKS